MGKNEKVGKNFLDYKTGYVLGTTNWVKRVYKWGQL